jgi:membrane-associated phospholipid phosphatase
MNETDLDMKKTYIYILIFAAVSFVIGLVLYLAGLNIWINELFYDNSIMYAIFSLITELGDTRTFVFLVVIVWYIYDKGFAKNLAYTVLGSGYVNNITKDIFQDPRPYTNIRDFGDGPEAVAEGFGFPSGHSQLAVSVYGYLAYEAHVKKSKIISWIFIIIVYLVAGSRLIIGVHDVQDVWGGITIGFIWLTLYIALEPIVSEKVSALSITVKIILALVIPIVLFIIGIFAFATPTGDYGLMCGAMMGLALGYILESEKIKYDPRVLNNKQRIINLVIGIVITLVLYLGLGLLPELPILDFVQYLILSFVLVTFVPWIFTKINRN